MGSLQNIVNVQISRLTSTPSRAGFGTGAFISEDAGFQNRTKVYSSYQEVVSDTFAGADLQAAAAAYFGQQLAPTKLTAIKRKSAVVQIMTLTFDEDFVASNSILSTVDGVDLTPVVFTSDQATTLAAVAAEIQTDASVTTATVTDTREITVTFADNDAHTLASVVTLGASQPVGTVVTTQYPDEAGTLTETLTEAIDENNDWYALCIYSRLDADITEVSDYIQAQGSGNPKLFFAQSSDAAILDSADSADIASITQAKANFRTSIWYHADDTEYLDMGVIGGQLPTDPGSITWAYKTISGVTVDSLLDSQKNAAFAKAANTYDTVSSVNITEEGKVSDSPFEWIDVIRGLDWLQTNMAADLYELLLQNPKISYDSAGLSLIRATMLNRLTLAQDQGVLSLDVQPTATVPDILDVSNSDKQNRVLNDAVFTGVLAGAIQKINVQGTVTLS